MTDYVPVILGRGLEILQKYGWSEQCARVLREKMDGPMNIRSAMHFAAQDVVPEEKSWYSFYIETMHLLTIELGGVSHWEFGVALRGGGRRERTHDEVVGKLTQIIEKVRDEAQVGSRRHPGRNRSSSRTV